MGQGASDGPPPTRRLFREGERRERFKELQDRAYRLWLELEQLAAEQRKEADSDGH